jgi:hypothetical protein
VDHASQDRLLVCTVGYCYFSLLFITFYAPSNIQRVGLVARCRTRQAFFDIVVAMSPSPPGYAAAGAKRTGVKIVLLAILSRPVDPGYGLPQGVARFRPISSRTAFFRPPHRVGGRVAFDTAFRTKTRHSAISAGRLAH